MNNEFKQFREIVENRDGSVIAHGGVIASFKHWYNSSFWGRFPPSTSVSPANLHSIFISFSCHLH
jgi:hypothetical protein